MLAHGHLQRTRLCVRVGKVANRRYFAFVLIGLTACSNYSKPPTQTHLPAVNQSGFTPSDWVLSWHDEFDYENAELDKYWDAQNSPSHHILSSRWRENVIVKNGVLHLENRKEQRGGQDWTSGSIRTKEQFGYGYYEARYKYAAANSTNNSFWLMSYPKNQTPAKGKIFEIDINEGHFPNEVNTNIHDSGNITIDTNGRKRHPTDAKSHIYGTQHKLNFPLENPVTTTKIRLVSNDHNYIHIRKFNVYDSVNTVERTNLVVDSGVSVSASGSRNNNTIAEKALDNNIKSSWTSQQNGTKWLELEWNSEQTVAEIEFFNGWDHNGSWDGLIGDFSLLYFSDGEWKTITELDVENEINFAQEYQTYGLEWNESEIIFYFNGEEIRRERNDFSHSLTPIWLSLAIIAWDGPVTDDIDGTSMKVDYVRYFKRKP